MSFESTVESKRCISIRYSPSANYKRAYVPCYGQFSANTWTLLSDLHRINSGCVRYCHVDLIKSDHVRLTRTTSMNDLSNIIRIPRTQTFYKNILLFDNSLC